MVVDSDSGPPGFQVECWLNAVFQASWLVDSPFARRFLVTDTCVVENTTYQFQDDLVQRLLRLDPFHVAREAGDADMIKRVVAISPEQPTGPTSVPSADPRSAQRSSSALRTLVGRVADASGLSARERLVLLLAAAGCSNAQICAETCSTTSTLNVYWLRIRRKTGLVSRTAIVGRVLNEVIDQVNIPDPLQSVPGDLAAVITNLARECALSPREREIVGFAALPGLSSKEIGAMLGISARTVEAAWSRIFDKLGMRSRREVVAALIAQAIHDLVRPPEPKAGQH